MTEQALRILHLEEPSLAFAYGQSASHPKDGLFLFGPLEEARPAELRVGVIGTTAGLGLFRRWVASVQRYLPPYKPDKAFHAAFPGFQAAFHAAWPARPLVEIAVPPEELRQRIRYSDRAHALFQTVDSFASRLLRHRREEDTQPDFWCIVIPEEIYRYGRPTTRPPKDERIPSNRPFDAKAGRKILREGSLFREDEQAAQIYRYEINFHNQLKARLLKDKLVVQIIRESSLATKDDQPTRHLQDPATLAWNLCTTAFFKAGGKPWKLADVRPGVCYVGLVFKKDDSDPRRGNACCGAQMFLNSGDGLVFKGHMGPWYSEHLKEFHLSRETARSLIETVVRSYTEQHGQPPAELFIHAKARFNDEEWQGFQDAVSPGTRLVAVRIQKARDVKLFRPGTHPVIRGTALRVTDSRAFLWTSGYVPRLGTYTGWEVPNPLLIDLHRGQADLEQVMRDVMGLTKVNFNACVFGDGLPVTLRFADAVGEILTAAPMEDLPPLPFRHYI